MPSNDNERPTSELFLSWLLRRGVQDAFALVILVAAIWVAVNVMCDFAGVA